MASRTNHMSGTLFNNDSLNQPTHTVDNKLQAESDSNNEYDESEDQLKIDNPALKKQNHRDTSHNSDLNKIQQLQRQSSRELGFDDPVFQTKEQVLKRNRKSAKECRERKKIYIDLLEKKAGDLRAEIEASKQQVRNDYGLVCRMIGKVDNERMKFITNKLDLERKLADELKKDNSEIAQMMMEMFLYKFDINGKYKADLLNGQFQNLARLLLDHKLLLCWDVNFTEFGGGLFDVIGNNTSNAHEKAAGLLQQRRVEMLNILKNLRDIKEQIKDEGDRIQYLTGELAKNIGWQQIIRYLIHPGYTISEAEEQVKRQSGSSIDQTVKQVIEKRTKL